MSPKEVLTEDLRQAGYDFITACEIAHKYIQEFLASGKPETTVCVYAGNKCIAARVLQRT